MNYNLSRFEVKPNSSTIEYKRVPQAYFAHGQFRKGTVILKPNKQGYIGDDLLDKIEYDRPDTTIVNVGVGQGKTETAYKLVDYYLKQENYVVIVVSPFKKLVKRDYDRLSEKYNVSHYELSEDATEDPLEITQRDVHIITINTLLLNPGEGNLQMKQAKINYVKGIRQYCEKKGKKVVFIFDEIHAGMGTYEHKFIFNLLRWKSLTHKCFVLSATFTEASLIAIEFIGRLTNDWFKIFEAPRVKFPEQADLHLYVTAEDYSGFDQTLLSPLVKIIEEEAKAGRKVHIITAHKDLARKITDKNSEYPLAKVITKHLNPQLLTADDTEEYDKDRCHVGTTFYTGVSFNSGKDALVIIMPSTPGKEDVGGRYGGIFTDGTVPIIQAVARLRGKGNIYIFLPINKELIEPTYQAQEPKELLKKHFTGTNKAYRYEDQFRLLKRYYCEQRKDIYRAVDALYKENKLRDDDGLYGLKTSIHYPELPQFILEQGDQYLAERFLSFGKNFSPYVLWAAFNDQFTNATVKEVCWVEKKVTAVELDENNLISDLTTHLGGLDEVKKLIAGKTILGAYNKVFEVLVKPADKGKVQISYNTKAYKNNDKSKISKDVHKAVVNLLYQVQTGSDNKIDSKDYLLERMAGAKNKHKKGQKLDEVEKAYLTLWEIRYEMLAYSKKYGGKLTEDFVTDERLKRLFEIAFKLVKEDKFIKSQVYSFVRLDGKNLIQAKAYLQSGIISKEFKGAYKKTFFNVLSNTFFTFKFNSKGGKKHVGKGIKQVAAERPLPKVSIFTKTFPK